MKRVYYISLLLSLASIASRGQVSVTGPECVVPGTIYQYTIAGNWDSASVMNVCVNGGVIGAPGDSTCTPQGKPVATVLVSWTTIGNGTVTVTSSLGNAVLNVTVIQPLTPGAIDSLSRGQTLAPGDTPAVIICDAASGGSCSPSFNYQWQRSPDRVSWQDMNGATNTDLAIDTALTESTYYRRKVTETTSGTISFSDIAAVFVGNFSYLRRRDYRVGCCLLAGLTTKTLKP